MPSINFRADIAVLLSLLIGLMPAINSKDCSVTTTGLIPITELGPGHHLGHQGGLYPGGTNQIPADHLELGLDLARRAVPLDEVGDPGTDGVIGVMSLGVSNTFSEFRRFMEVANADPAIKPQLVFVNGAQGGQGLDEWSVGPEATPWSSLAVEVTEAGLTSEQVQVAWMKMPDHNRGTPDLEEVDAEIDRLAEVARIAKSLYPNLRLLYVSSRTYGGYGGDRRSEPNAYQNGFAVKMLVERQIEGDPELNANPDAGAVWAPWLAWGPYLWADGVVPRSDGLVWECDDFADDGIHPAGGAQDKVAELLMQHFLTHPTTSSWFIGDATSTPTTTASSPPITTQSSSDRPTSRGERVPSEQGPGRPRPETASPASRTASDLHFDVAWLIAGAVLGFGISLTSIVVLTAPDRRRKVEIP